jgi:hypothetical protein
MFCADRELNSVRVIKPRSLAARKWYSSSPAEFSAIRRNRANSIRLLCPLPSTILAGTDRAARSIWLRNDTYSAPRIARAARWTFSINACAFLQTLSFLKSPTSNETAPALNPHHQMCALRIARTRVVKFVRSSLAPRRYTSGTYYLVLLFFQPTTASFFCP